MLPLRGVLASAWLVLIASFFYGRQPAGSPGLSIFWNLIWLLPALLMIAGHETWRRICPLSFFTQIPRMLGFQVKSNGSPRILEPTSWLARNHNYVQFGLLFIGISLRLLLLNSDELWLGLFLCVLLAAALLVGTLYGGRSWCQYFCPIAPVQRFYSSPAGLLESSAHLSARDVTQSMCRASVGGKDVPACVGCKVNCPDIDLEQAHWADLRASGRSLVHYGYPGLVLGFFLCLRVFGAAQASSFFQRDWVFAGQTVALPKFLAVPLLLALCIASSWLLFKLAEVVYGRVSKTHPDRALHQTSALATWITFNLFYALAAGPLLGWPAPLLQALGIVLAAVSMIWLRNTLGRTPYQYARERLVQGLREQLAKTDVDFPKLLNGRQLQSLNVDEIFVLAHTLPSFSEERRRYAYKNMLTQALRGQAEGNQHYLNILQEVRRSIDVTQEEHNMLLSDLEIEEKLHAESSKNREPDDIIRLSRYEQAASAYLLKRVHEGKSIGAILQDVTTTQQLKEIAIAHNLVEEERDFLLNRMREKERKLVCDAQNLVAKVAELKGHLTALRPFREDPLTRLIFRALAQEKIELSGAILRGFREIGDTEETRALASQLSSLARDELALLLASHQVEGEKGLQWAEVLPAEILELLLDQAEQADEPEDAPGGSLAEALARLPLEKARLIEAVIAYRLAQEDFARGQAAARQLASQDQSSEFVRQTVSYLLNTTAEELARGLQNPNVVAPRLSYLLQHRFFEHLSENALISVASRFKTVHFKKGQVLIQKGAVATDLILLCEGEAHRFAGETEGARRTGKHRSRFFAGERISEIHSTLKGRYASSVIAAGEVTLLVINQNDLSALVGQKGSVNWLSTQRDLISRVSLDLDNYEPALTVGMKIEFFTFDEQNDVVAQGTIVDLQPGKVAVALDDAGEGFQQVFVPGRMINATFKAAGTVARFGFVSYVLEPLAAAQNLYEIEAPQSYFPCQPRRKVRVECEWPGHLFFQRNDRTGRASFVTKDVGAGGASLLFFENLPIATGDMVNLEIETPSQGVLECEAKVLRRQELKLPNDVRQYILCVSFENLYQELQNRLYRLVFNILRKNVETTQIDGHSSWMGSRQFRVSQIVEEGPAVRSFYLAPVDGLPLPPFVPGQFLTFKFMISDAQGNLSPVVRCYSLSDSHQADHYRITVKRVDGWGGQEPGQASNFLHGKVAVGDILHVSAPRGSFTFDDQGTGGIVLIAGGIGITPLLSMLHCLAAQGSHRDIWLFYGVRNGPEHIFKQALSELQPRLKNLKIHTCYSQPTPEDVQARAFLYKGHLSSKLILSMLPKSEHDFYICGPNAMMYEVIRDLLECEVPHQKIHYEAFGPNKINQLVAEAAGQPAEAPCEVRFASSNKTLHWQPEDGTLLEFAEANGIKIPSGCRLGNCTRCAVSLRSGEVRYDRVPPSDPGPKLCLVCIGRPHGDITLDV